jgi:hypothetical protein
VTPVDDRQLRALRDEAASRLALRLGEPDAPLVELRELHERFRLAEAALADPRRQRAMRLRIVIGSMLVVAVLLSLAATIRMPTVAFSLELDADAAQLRFGPAGELGAQPLPGSLQARGWARLETADATLRTLGANTRPPYLALSAQSLRLQRVAYPANSLLRLAAGPATLGLTFEAPQGVLRLELDAAGPATLNLGNSNERVQLDFGPGEWLGLEAGDSTSDQRPPPLDLQLGRSGAQTLSWLGLQPQGLRFVDRQSTGGGQTRIVSTLQRATVNLPATGGTVRLQAGDRLEIDGLEVERFELIAGNSLSLRVSGKAREMRSGVGGFDRSLKPSVLEFVARNHVLLLLWSAAAGLWGAGLWLRKLLA